MPVNTRFRDLTQRLPFQVLPRIYFSSGGAEGNVSVKQLISTFGPSSGIMHEIREKSQMKNDRDTSIFSYY